MIEVLVTIVIVSIGLLGLAQLQSKLQLSEVESYQRAQALVLLKDMASRIASNRAAAVSYVTGSPIGVGMTCPALTVASTRQQRDAAQWCRSLQGAAEQSGAADAGGMIGARGCVQVVQPNSYLITVAWQGLIPVSAPPAGVSCAANAYDGGADGACSADRCRRVVTTVVRIGTL